STSTMCSARCRRALTPDPAVPPRSCFPPLQTRGRVRKGREECNETRVARQETRTSPPTDPADAVGGAGNHSPVPADVQGVSAAPEGGGLHHRSGVGEDERGCQRRGALRGAGENVTSWPRCCPDRGSEVKSWRMHQAQERSCSQTNNRQLYCISIRRPQLKSESMLSAVLYEAKKE